MRMRLVGVVLFGLLVAVAAPRSDAQGWAPEAGRPGVVLEAAGEFGGDNILKVFYTNGDTQDIRAGQGVRLSIGAHYRPVSFPIDFAATVGYKFVRTADYHTNLGMDRVVFQFTGTYALPNHFWVDAGPVWHTSVKLNGGNYIPDVSFDDAVGVTAGAGWRWLGVSYTHIRYNSAVTGGVDGSNVGATFTWKF